MPKISPTLSIEHLRNLTEKWSWEDLRGQRHVGYNVPKDALKVERVPYVIKFVASSTGKLDCGTAVTLKVFPRKMQRLIQYVGSGDTRRVCDYLIAEIDGTRIVTH